MHSIAQIFRPSLPPLVVAEVAQSHDGSLGLAHAFIDVAARCGAGAIKFQTHIAHEESSRAEPWRVRFSRQDASRYAYWQRMEFSSEQWAGLKEHADELGLVFLSSPFSIAAVTLLHALGMPAWKIASGEVTNPFLMDAVIETGKPVLLSSGMSRWDELDRAVARVKSAGVSLAVLQCTTAYPCPPEKVGINILGELASRYAVPVGLSDHSGTIYPSLAATCHGARVLEVHLTLSRDMFGPDVPASLTPDELTQLTRGVSWMHSMLASPVDKDLAAGALMDVRSMFGRSLVVARALPAGHVVARSDLSDRKPGIGIPVERWQEVVGLRTTQALDAGTFILPEHLESR